MPDRYADHPNRPAEPDATPRPAAPVAPSVASPGAIHTRRLLLVPATPELVAAEMSGPAALTAALGVNLPADWPPEHHDTAALQFFLDRLAEGSAQAGWWLWYVVRKAWRENVDAPLQPPEVIGVGGFKGPPRTKGPAVGDVEIGYSVVPSQWHRGYATEAATAWTLHALALPTVQRVIAETLPVLDASIRVLERCGFALLPGEGSEPGVIRFAMTRSQLGDALSRHAP